MLWKLLWRMLAGVVLAGSVSGLEKIELIVDGQRLDDRHRAFRAGDLVYVGNMAIRLDGQGRQEFVVGPHRNVFRLAAEGERVLVACTISDEIVSDHDAGHREPVNAIEWMTDAEARRIQGVTIRVWKEAVRRSLERLDLTRCCVTISLNVMNIVPLPDLPAGTRAVCVTQRVSGLGSGYRDLTPLAALKELAQLDLSRTSWQEGQPLDLAPLAGLPLRELRLPFARQAENVEVIGQLTNLERFDGSRADYLGEMRWLSGLSRLRELELSGLGASENEKYLARLKDRETSAEVRRLLDALKTEEAEAVAKVLSGKPVPDDE